VNLLKIENTDSGYPKLRSRPIICFNPEDLATDAWTCYPLHIS
jgi:hypothetical protein